MRRTAARMTRAQKHEPMTSQKHLIPVGCNEFDPISHCIWQTTVFATGNTLHQVGSTGGSHASAAPRSVTQLAEKTIHSPTQFGACRRRQRSRVHHGEMPAESFVVLRQPLFRVTWARANAARSAATPRSRADLGRGDVASTRSHANYIAAHRRSAAGPSLARGPSSGHPPPFAQGEGLRSQERLDFDLAGNAGGRKLIPFGRVIRSEQDIP